VRCAEQQHDIAGFFEPLRGDVFGVFDHSQHPDGRR
jgi:hypothetical protein